MVVIDYRIYPFISDLRAILNTKYPGLRIEDVLVNSDSYPFKRSLYLLKTIIGKGYVSPGKGSSDDEVLTFYALLVGAKTIGDRRLLYRIANAYSKQAYRRLMEEPLTTLVSIARLLGIDARLVDNPPKVIIGVRKKGFEYYTRPIALPVKQFLRIVSKRLAKDPKYMLVNQILDHGYVYVDKEVFIRMLEEKIYERIIEIYERLEYDPGRIEEYIEKYREVLNEMKWFEKRIYSEDLGEKIGYVPEALPPCMKILVEKLVNGENLSHHERFTVAAFLARIGLDPEAILEFFKNAPDFNEKIARYQIEHIAGLRGSRKKYLPYNCDTMKSLNICPIKDYCEGGKNPLTIYRKNLWRLKKGREDEAERETT